MGGGRISNHQWGVCNGKEKESINALCASDWKDAPKVIEDEEADTV